ncbi:transposase-like protein [Bradyrhizobium japonicum]
MTETTNVLAFRQPSAVDDPLTDIVRAGARDLLARAIEIEVGAFLASTANLTLPDGRARLVRHGHGPVREIATGIGPVEVARPKVRDRGASGPGDRLRFSSAILPLWARRTKSLDALIPVLYLRGISTGDFQEALSALLGKDAPNLSPSVIAGLKADWQVEYERWQRRDLSARRYVYIWADGVYLQARMEDHSECMLVLIGTTPEGKKELIGFQVGVRESAQSWRELLIDLRQRGLRIAPQLAIGDGALGFWKALDEAFPGTRHQRCWCHKVSNVVLIGTTPEGKKELIGFQVGVRESAQSWRELLIDLRQRGLRIAPQLAIGDGALGFWKALDEAFPGTRHQRCWCHKVSNVLDKVAKSVQGPMKNDLRNIYLAPHRAEAETAIDVFVEKYHIKYGRAVECLIKDRHALLAFFDFPAEHWIHLRSSNPIESVFATVRHRTVRTKGSLSQQTAKLMVFKLIDAASKTWRRLKSTNQLPKVIAGVKFIDGIEVIPNTESHAA